MKKITVRIIVSFTLIMAVVLISTNGSSTSVDAATLPRDYGIYKYSKAQRQEMAQPFAKKYRGTWYSYNSLQKKWERYKITKRSFTWQYKNKNGKWQTIDKFAGKHLGIQPQGKKIYVFTYHYSKNVDVENSFDEAVPGYWRSGDKFLLTKTKGKINGQKRAMLTVTHPRAKWSPYFSTWYASYNKQKFFRYQLKQKVGKQKIKKSELAGLTLRSGGYSQYNLSNMITFNHKNTGLYFYSAVANPNGTQKDEQTGLGLNTENALKITKYKIKGDSVLLRVAIDKYYDGGKGYYELGLKKINSKTYQVWRSYLKTKYDGLETNNGEIIGKRFVVETHRRP